MRDLPTSRYCNVSDLCSDIPGLHDKLAAAEREIDSGAIGEDFLLLAELLRANIHGTI